MKVFWTSLTVMAVLLGSASCNECVNNFTSAQDPSSLMNITLLPRGDETNDFGQFSFRQWLFPNLRFGCNGNLSMIIVRTNSSEGDSAPRLTLWRDAIGLTDFYNRIDEVDPPTDQVIPGQNLDRIVYTFDPPVEVMENLFVGFLFNYSSSKLHSHRIVFEDAGEGRAPVSIHTSTTIGFGFIQVDNVFTEENEFIPLITAVFAEDPVITTPPPTTARMIVPMTTTVSTPRTIDPPQVLMEPDIGLIVGIVVAFLLVILIVILAIITAMVVRRKEAQQNIYDVPVEPRPPNLDNPVYREEVIELDSKKLTTEMMSSNPSYMPTTDASINYEEEHDYSYIDPEDEARNPIVGEDDIETDQVVTSSNVAYSIAGRSGDSSEMATSAPLTREEMHHPDQVPTADNICYGSAIPQDSDQVPTADNVCYGSAIPQDHSDHVPTADNICYGSAIPQAIPQDHSDHVPTADNVAYGSTIR